MLGSFVLIRNGLHRHTGTPALIADCQDGNGLKQEEEEEVGGGGEIIYNNIVLDFLSLSPLLSLFKKEG